MLVPDYHIHTPFCKHASGSLEEYVSRACTLGMTEICFTDHIPDTNGYDPRHRMEIDQFQDYVNSIKRLNDNKKVNVLIGVEADYYPGCEEFLQEFLERWELDLVLGSVHFISGWGFDDPDQLPVWKKVDIRDTWEKYFSLVHTLVSTGLFDVVAHLDLPKKFGHCLSKEVLVPMVEPLLKDIKARDMVLEVNTSGLRKPVGEIYPSVVILNMAKRLDIDICLGSDAHSPQEVGWEFPRAIQTLKELGFTHITRFQGRKKSLLTLP